MDHAPDDAGGAAMDDEPMTVTLSQMIEAARDSVREIPPAQAAAALNSREVDLIVDVREPEEYRAGHVPDAVNIPRGMLEILADPASPAADPALSSNRSARVLVYCAKAPGARALLSAQTLASMGYEHVQALAGGLAGWSEAGLPTQHDHQEATT
jgi:rhodanese-related sulfurtransferase